MGCVGVYVDVDVGVCTDKKKKPIIYIFPILPSQKVATFSDVFQSSETCLL